MRFQDSEGNQYVKDDDSNYIPWEEVKQDHKKKERKTPSPDENLTAEEKALNDVIDQIWDTYDVDKSGALDRDECEKFVIDTLGNLGCGSREDNHQMFLREIFPIFDRDNSGFVEKSEMVVFIRQLLPQASSYNSRR